MNKQKLLKQLETIFDRCSAVDWDGYQGLPLTEEVMKQARFIITHLPESLSVPLLIPIADGSVEFEWRNEKNVCILATAHDNEYIFVASPKSRSQTIQEHELVYKVFPMLQEYFGR